MVAVRSVVGEESQLSAVEGRLLQSPAGLNHQIPKPEVGLVIGKVYPDLDRAPVYTLIPTPPTDSGLSPCDFVSTTTDHNKKKKAAAASTAPPPPLLIDTEWVAEHARQASRMLLGGVDVVGVYIWASEASFKASTPILCQTVKAVAQAANQFHHYDGSDDQRLLLHISYSPRRWTCRICSLTSTNSTSALRPCDFKMGKLLPSLQCFTCTYNFHMRLPIFRESPNSYAFKDVIQFGISCLAKELKSSKALIDGNLVTEDLQCTSEGPHEVELLLPFMKEPFEICRPDKVLGVVLFSGVICASAYLGSRAHISHVISDIKGDIISSLQSRLDIICEETEGDEILPATNSDSSEGISVQESGSQLILHKARNPCNLLFPKRVVIPWLPSIYICDYVKQSETFEDVKDHCKEMMSMEISTEKEILEPEKEAKAITDNSFWSSVGENSVSAADPLTKNVDSFKGNDGHRSSHFSLNVLVVTIVIVLLSVFIAWLLNYSLGKEIPRL